MRGQKTEEKQIFKKNFHSLLVFSLPLSSYLTVLVFVVHWRFPKKQKHFFRKTSEFKTIEYVINPKEQFQSFSNQPFVVRVKTKSGDSFTALREVEARPDNTCQRYVQLTNGDRSVITCWWKDYSTRVK